MKKVDRIIETAFGEHMNSPTRLIQITPEYVRTVLHNILDDVLRENDDLTKDVEAYVSRLPEWQQTLRDTGGSHVVITEMQDFIDHSENLLKDQI